MKRFCAWCGTELPDKPPFKDKRITHSICGKCCDTRLKQLRDERRAREFDVVSDEEEEARLVLPETRPGSPQWPVG